MKFGSDLGSGQFHVLVILIRHLDMVAEQVHKNVIWCSQLLRRMITLKTDTSQMTITSSSSSSSSSGKERRFKGDLHLKEGAEVNMFAHDHSLNPRVPQPMSFDGVRPSFMEWSKVVIAFLAVTDYQEFIPLLTAVASSKDVIRAVVFTGALSDNVEEIKKNNEDQIKRK